MTRIGKLQAYNKLYNEGKNVKWRINYRMIKGVTVIEKSIMLWRGKGVS